MYFGPGLTAIIDTAANGGRNTMKFSLFLFEINEAEHVSESIHITTLLIW